MNEALSVLQFIGLMGFMIFGWYGMYKRHGLKFVAWAFVAIIILAFILSRLIRE